MQLAKISNGTIVFLTTGDFILDKRHKIFFSLTAAVFFIILLRMLFLASALGDSCRQEAGKIACKTGKLAAIRGRIYQDPDTLLVWSERCYDLVFDGRKCSGKRHKTLQKMLTGKFPSLILPENVSAPTVIKYNLTASELAPADELSSIYKEFSVDLRWERRSHDSPLNTGEVRQIDGMESGISGWEKEFDDRLRGKPGTFSVMLDRHGKWINSTFRIIEPAQAGEDIFLDEEKENDAP